MHLKIDNFFGITKQMVNRPGPDCKKQLANLLFLSVIFGEQE